MRAAIGTFQRVCWCGSETRSMVISRHACQMDQRPSGSSTASISSPSPIAMLSPRLEDGARMGAVAGRCVCACGTPGAVPPNRDGMPRSGRGSTGPAPP